MRRMAGVVAGGTLLLGLGLPAAAAERPAAAGSSQADRYDDRDRRSDEGGRYRHHERYRGDHYDYNEHRGSDPYTEAGPYDGYYHCWRSEGPGYRSETWCDHYYGREPQRRW